MNPIILGTLVLGVFGSAIWFYSVRNLLGFSKISALGFAFLHVLIGGLFAKLFAMFDFWSIDMFVGWRLYGPVFFLPILYIIAAKISKKKLAVISDVFSISVMISLFFFRFSCLYNGCCAGTKIPFLPQFHWPIRELEMILYIILIIIYVPKIKREETYGQVYPVFMIVYGIFRFIVEWVREEYVSVGGTFIHKPHIYSIICFVIGISIYLELINNKKRGKGKNGKKYH